MPSRDKIKLLRQQRDDGHFEKVRNPANAPNPHEAQVLTQSEALKAQRQLRPQTEHGEVVVEEGKRYLRYLKPIVIASPLCLTCHGSPEELGPGVKAQLQALYPHNQATGYRLEELRGSISIKIRLEEKQQGDEACPPGSLPLDWETTTQTQGQCDPLRGIWKGMPL
ncbi:MAG: DUF3365 domain-containing protein [Nitrospinae bacterium]|nr:DUF3365 domain-containing protein [Nitrospinota bacterium]